MRASSGQVDMYTLQKLLTHKSPLMTQRYTHLHDEALKRASEVAGDIITRVSKGVRQVEFDVSDLSHHTPHLTGQPLHETPGYWFLPSEKI